MSAVDYWFDRAEAEHADKPVVQPERRVKLPPGKRPDVRVYVSRRKRQRMAMGNRRSGQ